MHTAIGRSADNAWVQLVSADGDTGWVSANAVMVTGGLNASADRAIASTKNKGRAMSARTSGSRHAVEPCFWQVC